MFDRLLRTRSQGYVSHRVMLFTIAALAVVGFLPLSIDWQSTLTLALGWAIAATALDLWQGYVGEVSFGHGVFVAIGAYGWALLRGAAELPVGLALVGCVLLAAAVAAVLGAAIVQLSHFGAAIVTFFVAFIASAFLNSSLARGLVGGQVGLNVPPLEVFGLDLSEGQPLYFTALALLALAMFVTVRYTRSSSGRALEMLRESTLVGSLLGIRVKRARFLAFTTSGAVASLGGIVIAQMLFVLTPESFSPVQSVILVAMVIVGGQRTVVGPIIGAIAYQALSTTFQSQPEMQALYSALVFLVFVVLAPAGLVGLVTLIRSKIGPNTPPDPPAAMHPDNDPAPLAPVPLAAALPGDGPALRVHDVSVEFGGVHALRGAGLEAAPAEIHALIGPNGAGKTTLINVVTGIQPSATGSVSMFGEELRGKAPQAIRELGVSRTFQDPALVATLTLLDNVRLGLYSEERRNAVAELALGRLRTTDGPETTARCEAALRLVGVPPEHWDSLPTEVSFAMRKLADLGRALVQSPQVLLLDEPTAGVSEDEMRLLEHAIANVGKQGTTVIVVAHHVPFIRRVAHTVTVLDAGSNLAHGEPEEVTRSDAVMEAFIGRAEVSAGPARRRPPVAVDRVVGGVNTVSTLNDGLHVRGLRARYGAATVINGLDLDVRPGEVIALTGPNGVGKTTALRALSGLVEHEAQALWLGGKELPGEPHAAARAGLIHVPEGRGVISSLSVAENLRLGALAVGRSPDLDMVHEVFPKLKRLEASQAGLLSGGERQMLAIARGLLGGPSVLMIDEFSLGLSPKAAREALDFIVRIAHNGPGVLIVDQGVGALAEVCDRIYVLREGAAHEIEGVDDTVSVIRESYF